VLHHIFDALFTDILSNYLSLTPLRQNRREDMNLKKILTTAAILGAVTFSASTASAQSAYVADLSQIGFTLTAANGDSCLACHASAWNATNKDKGVTPFAADYKLGVATFSAITAGEALALGLKDSDGDGIDNATEAAAGTNFWGVVPSAPASSGGGGCVTSSVTTPLMMVLAMLSLGFFVRRKKD